MTENYAEGLKDILLRKIDKAERDLHQLKLDYCRFVYGLSHRAQVESGGKVYQVKAVHIDSMQRLASGEWSQPEIACVELNGDGEEVDGSTRTLAPGWSIK